MNFQPKKYNQMCYRPNPVLFEEGRSTSFLRWPQFWRATSGLTSMGSEATPIWPYKYLLLVNFCARFMVLTWPHLTSADQIEVTAGQGKVSTLRKALGHERAPKTLRVGTILVGAIFSKFSLMAPSSSLVTSPLMVKFKKKLPREINYNGP